MYENSKKTQDAQRRNIPGRLRLAIFQETFSKCPFCGLEKIGSLEVHHINGNHSDNTPENLIAVCASCHAQISKGLIEEKKVVETKAKLQNGIDPFPKKSVSDGDTVNMNITTNNGIIANHLTIHGKQKTGRITLPGSIGTDLKKYNYVEYLIKQLSDFREKGKSYGQVRKGKVHYGATRKILEKQLGGLPKDLPIEKFEEIVMHIQEKIDNTILGKRNRSQGIPNYHSYEDHGQPKRT